MFCLCFQMGWGFHGTFFVSSSATSATPHSLGRLKKPVALFAKAEDRPTAVASFFGRNIFPSFLLFCLAFQSGKCGIALSMPRMQAKVPPNHHASNLGEFASYLKHLLFQFHMPTDLTVSFTQLPTRARSIHIHSKE